MSKRLYLMAAFAAAILVASPATTEAQTEQPQAQAQKLISVIFVNAALRDVIAGMAAFSGTTIVVNREVGNPPVNAEFANIEWKVALDEILEKQGLVAETEPVTGIIKVRKRAPAPPRPTKP
jgi:hypothetical protein